MQQKNYKKLLYFITGVILVTLTIQVYWNFKNYQISKQQLIHEVQVSLDNVVDQYYEKLAKDQTYNFISKRSHFKYISDTLNLNKVYKNFSSSKSYIAKSRLSQSKHTKHLAENSTTDFEASPEELNATMWIKCSDSVTISKKYTLNKNEVNSLQKRLNTLQSPDSINTLANIISQRNVIDSEVTPFENLTSKIIIAISQDELEVEKIDSLLTIEFSRKNITIDYNLSYTAGLQIIDSTKIKHNKISSDKNQLSTKSKSSYLPSHSSLALYFTNSTLTILKKNLFGILLSFLLITSVIGCLLYLLKIINHQKQLAELKNDLISNITHEFKTPIATISAAIEGIHSFNQENNKEKTKKYAAISSDQLGKLNTMVEKILETATLDSDELQLNFEEVNLVELVNTIINKHKGNSPKKNITSTSSHENIWKTADVFHLENAINNIVDNAIKYGGDTITLAINNTTSTSILEIKDTGTSLNKTHKENIFKKFYRVPKGNTHDVKGFGIGLFYTKTIIEKHNGTIQLLLDQGHTNFKIILPND